MCAKDTGQRDTQPHTRKTQPPSPGGERLTAPRASPLNPPVSRRGWGDEGELQTGPSDSDAPGCGDGCPSLRMKDGPRLALGMGVCVVRGLCLSKTYCQKMLKRHVEHHVALTWLLIWPRAEIWKPKREIRAPVWSGTLRDTQVLNWRLGGSLAGGGQPCALQRRPQKCPWVNDVTVRARTAGGAATRAVACGPRGGHTAPPLAFPSGLSSAPALPPPPGRLPACAHPLQSVFNTAALGSSEKLGQLMPVPCSVLPGSRSLWRPPSPP